MSDFKRNIAIIIGINDYQSGIPTLATAVNDAKKIARVLEQQHNYKVWKLLNKRATLSNCLRMFEEFLPQQIQKSDRLIFYFAGHGIALNGDDGPEGFLIPQDARLGDTSSYLPMVRLQQALDKLPCRHFLTVLDCCFAGAFRWSSMRKLLIVPDVIHRQHYDRFLESSAWQVITSASHNQTASDSLALPDQSDRGITPGDHSPFAAALIEALEGAADSSPPGKDGEPPGDGVITASELYLYLRDRVELATEKKGVIQTPGLYPLKKHDRGEYIFHSPVRKLNLSTAPPLDESQNPYLGLKSFDGEHSELFFGRQALTEQLYQFCDRNPLTVVLGASGTGKSSLVKAGLIPYIQKLQQSKSKTDRSWQILPTMRPGESAFKALNKILSEYQSSGSSILSRNSLEKNQILSGRIEYLLSKNPKTKLLLVIDQTEELITLSSDSAERDNFLSLLNKWLQKYPQFRVVLTLRSDFEPQFRNLALKSAWQKARFIVPAMTREELREAIEKPAAARVMYFEPNSLVDRLIDEVAQMPGALPLLSFALSELYFKYLQKFRAGTRDKRAITQADYQEIGGVAQSLTQRADREYNKLVEKGPGYAETIRYVMLRTIAVGGGELARRRVPLAELRYPAPEDERVKEIIKSFTAARLLVEGQDAEMNPYVEPAHDALVRGWQKLLNWKREEEDSLSIQRRLTPAAQEWKNLEYSKKQSAWRGTKESLINWFDARLYSMENLFYITRDGVLKLVRDMSNEQNRWLGKSEQYLWNTNPYLNVLKEKLESNNYLFNQIEAEFLQISIRRRRNNRRRLIASVILVMSSLSLLTIYALWQKGQAENNLDRAVKAEEREEKAESEAEAAKKAESESLDRVRQLEAQYTIALNNRDNSDSQEELESVSEEELNRIKTELDNAKKELSQAQAKSAKAQTESEQASQASDRIFRDLSGEDETTDAAKETKETGDENSEIIDGNEEPDSEANSNDETTESDNQSENENIDLNPEASNEDEDLDLEDTTENESTESDSGIGNEDSDLEETNEESEDSDSEAAIEDETTETFDENEEPELTEEFPQLNDDNENEDLNSEATIEEENADGLLIDR